MVDPTFDQVVEETGLSRSQVRRFISLTVLKSVAEGRISRDSVDALKEKYIMPPKEKAAEEAARKIIRQSPKVIRVNQVMQITGLTGPEAQKHLRELRLPAGLEQAYVDRMVEASQQGTVTIDIVRCPTCGSHVMVVAGDTDLKCPRCSFTRSRSL